jgi:hypothetical protein
LRDGNDTPAFAFKIEFDGFSQIESKIRSVPFSVRRHSVKA